MEAPMANKPLTEAYAKDLLDNVARVEAEKTALIEEFTKEIKDKGKTFSDEDIKDKIKTVLPTAFAGLQDLLENAESETVKASLIKYVFDSALLILKKETADDKNDPIKELMASLEKNDGKANKKAKTK
jgi:hypothetical protein